MIGSDAYLVGYPKSSYATAFLKVSLSACTIGDFCIRNITLFLISYDYLDPITSNETRFLYAHGFVSNNIVYAAMLGISKSLN